jgi:hypothetical protein
MWRVAAALSLACALVLPAWGHDSEPINTNFAAPFARGAGNLQFKLQVFRKLATYEMLPVEFEYGFAPRQQFSLGMALMKSQDGSQTYYRAGNMEFGYRLLVAGNNQGKYALSINPNLELPTGDKRVAEKAWTAGGTLNLDTHFSEKWWTHTNVGYSTQVARIADREKLLVYNNAVMYETGSRVWPVLEVIGETDLAAHQTRVAIAPEAIWAPNHEWELKAAVPLGLTQAAASVGLQIAVTWKFGERGRQ